MRSISSLVLLLLTIGLMSSVVATPQASAQEAGGGDGTDPLTVTLTSSRDVCTANTLTELTWTITGGVPPYRLTVAGEAVDPDAESATVTCGALPDGVTEAPGTITATVTDATGAPATASAAYTIVPPLPAPTGIPAYPLRTSIGMRWDRVAAAGPVPPLGSDCPCPMYVVRWRVDGSPNWTSHLTWDRTSSSGQTLAGTSLPDLREGTTYEVSIATLRNAIEQETPGALTWSAPITTITWAPATGVRATATHDTITVTWDSQPATDVFEVSIFGPDGSARQFFRGDGTTPHKVVFNHLPSDTEYTVRVWVAALDQGPRTEITARTTAAPPGWTPLPRGPQNLRTSVTHNSVTVDWDAPHAGANDHYHVFLFHTGADREPTAADRREHKPLYGTGTTEHTFTGLAPATTYRVAVRHPDIISGRVEVAVTTLARAAPPLRLTLTADRAECTAGTLNPVTWEISGGVEPYRLTVDGASVDADAEGAHATCGALPDYGIWLPVTQAPGTIPGTVTDATGAPATASAAYTIVEPLPAPANFRVGVHPGFVYSYWDTVRGAGSQFPEVDASQLSPAELDKRNLDGYLVRYRTDAASAWTYAEHSDGELTALAGYLRPWDTPPPGTFYTASVAAARHPLELQTPEALNWGAPIRYTTSGPAQNLTVRSTHNTVTVSWSKQPGTEQAYATLYSPGGGVERRYVAEGDEPGTHTVTFTHLEPNSEYTIWIFRNLGEGRGAVSRSFRTESAPPDWQPLPRGPQNLRATATHDTITVTWDPPFEGASPKWSMAMLDGEILVHSVQVSDGTTTWVSSGEVDSIGRYRIRPDTTYTIIVRHEGVYLVKQTITVTTQSAPAAQSTGPAITCIEITPGWRICWTPAAAPG